MWVRTAPLYLRLYTSFESEPLKFEATVKIKITRTAIDRKKYFAVLGFKSEDIIY
jgi:hypothetical protein